MSWSRSFRFSAPLIACAIVPGPLFAAAGRAGPPASAPANQPSDAECHLLASEIDTSAALTEAQRTSLNACKEAPGITEATRKEVTDLLDGAGEDKKRPPGDDDEHKGTARALAARAFDGSATDDAGVKTYIEALNDASRLRTKSGGVGRGAVPDKVVEFFSILADVAVKRAKRNGLVYLQDRLSAAVCTVQIAPTGKPEAANKLQLELVLPGRLKKRPTVQGAIDLFPDTCALLKTTPLERIASEPEALAAAVTTDLTAVLVFQVINQTVLDEPYERTLSQLLHLARRVAARALQTKNFSIQASDVNLLVDALISDHVHGNTNWRDKAVAVGVGGLGLAIVRSDGSPAKLAATNVPLLLEDLCPDEGIASTITCSADERHDASLLTSLGIKALTAVDASGSGDIEARVKAGVQLLFAVARRATVDHPVEPGGPEEPAPELKAPWARKTLDHLESLILASLDRDMPRALSAAARLLEAIVAENAAKCGGKCDQSPKYSIAELTTLLSSIATYASTYIPPEEGQPAPSPEALRESRTAAVEAAIAAFTNRNNRHGQWVLSIGLPVGFTMGGQSFRAVNAEERIALLAPQAMLPQLSLPLGLAVQRLPGWYHRRRDLRPNGKFFFDGFHAMVSALDLGQFVSYDARGDIAKPTWNSFMSLGGQLGWLIGSPANAFVLAADVRYAPSLFKSGDGSMAGDQPGGALRFGLFVGYYFSLFDFK